MTFSVVWTIAARDMLARIWMAAPDRNAVTVASHEVEERLKRNPLHEGESRENDHRVTFEAPLRIVFRVMAEQNAVYVISIGYYS